MTENAGVDRPGPDPETDATQRMEDPAAVEDEPERLYEA
jgi:hypothetical protein